MQGEQPSTVSSSPSTLLAPSAHARRALVMPYPCDRSDSAVRARKAKRLHLRGQDASSTARRHTSRALLSVRGHVEIVCAVRVHGEASTFTGQDASSTARPHTRQALLSVRRHAESVCAVHVQNELSTFTGQDAPPIAHPRATRSCRNAPTSPFRGSSARNANRRGATPCPGGPPGTLPHRLYR